MITASKLVPGGRGLAAALLRRATRVEADWDLRQKSRFECTDSAGRTLGVFLPRGTVVRGGDVLVAEDGSLVHVAAAPQPVLVVRVAPGGRPLDLLRAAYHLGNRHVALDVQPDQLTLEPDHVLADLLRALGLAVEATHAPFEPEGGAYAAAAGHAHGEHAGHEHEHERAHDHRHGHRHDDGHASAPDHQPGQGHAQ